MLKAAAGGGRAGIRRVDDEAELVAVIEQAAAEAQASFGDARLYVEALLSGARHLEVTVVADRHGKVWTFGPNDATLRRRGDKVVIESAAAGLSPADIKAVRGAAATLMPLVGYRGVATVAFVHVPGGGPPRFLEVYPRLSPDHAVVEETTGVDLVRLQLHVGLGGRLEGEPPEPRGVAIQARLNAEDPERGFAPAPGRVARLRLGAGPGIRVDAAVGEDDVIAPGGPMLVAQTLAWGPSRDEARVRLRRAIDETTVVIDGGSTNKGFLLDILERPEVRDADVDNAFIDRLATKGEIAVERDADVALLVAAIDAYESERGVDQLRFFASAHRGRPRTAPEVGRTVELRHRGHGYRVHVARRGPNTYAVNLDGTDAAISLESLGPYERRLHLGSRTSRIVSAVQGDEHLVEVDGTPHRFRRDDQGVVRSPTPGVVVAVPVGVGDEVAAGVPVAVIESMKMETAVARRSPAVCDAFSPVRTSRSTPARHWSSWMPPGQIRTPPTPPPALLCRRRMTTTPTSGRDAGAASPLLRGLMLGYDIEAAAPGRRLPIWPRRGPPSIAIPSSPAPRTMCSSPSPTFGCCTAAYATRPTPTSRCAPPRNTSTPTSGRSTSKGRVCRRRSWRRCAVRWATTGSTTSNGHRSSTRRCTGSTSHSSASMPRFR